MKDSTSLPAGKVSAAPLANFDTLLDQAAERGAERALEKAAELFGSFKSDEPILSDRERLAHQLGVSLPTVDRLRREGMPTIWLTPEAPRFELDAVLVWLRDRKAGAK